MKIQDIKLGMKVVPISKTPDGRQQGLKNCSVWHKAKDKQQDYLFITWISSDDAYLEICLDSYMSESGDYFLASDIVPYSERPVVTVKEFSKFAGITQVGVRQLYLLMEEVLNIPCRLNWIKQLIIDYAIDVDSIMYFLHIFKRLEVTLDVSHLYTIGKLISEGYNKAQIVRDILTDVLIDKD